jgi:hypothetical protein
LTQITVRQIKIGDDTYTMKELSIKLGVNYRMLKSRLIRDKNINDLIEREV